MKIDGNWDTLLRHKWPEDEEMEILEECPHCGKEAKYQISKEKLLKKRGRLKCQGCGTKILMCSECTGAHCVDQPNCFELREG